MKKEYEYNGVILDSYEEYQFVMYLKDLKQNNYIKNFEKNTISLEIYPAAKIDIKYLNKKNIINIKEKHLLHNLSYTYDFKIEWLPKAKNVFYINLIEIFTFNEKLINKIYFHCLESDVSYIDVKGSFAGRNNNSAITFPIIQKILFSKGQFIQKVIPKKLFKETFVPQKELLTSTGKIRVFNFAIKTIKEYAESI